uniref:Uncharacterized protein n=1 Tax=Ixodes ricinus TaxID=34613 RepID=A0A0K8RB21_IXORI
MALCHVCAVSWSMKSPFAVHQGNAIHCSKFSPSGAFAQKWRRAAIEREAGRPITASCERTGGRHWPVHFLKNGVVQPRGEGELCYFSGYRDFTSMHLAKGVTITVNEIQKSGRLPIFTKITVSAQASW